MIDLPIFKTFEVDYSITDFLNKKLLEYKKSKNSYDDFENCFTDKTRNSGFQTENLLNWDDEEFIYFRKNKLLDLILSHINIDKSSLSYHWIHMLEYENGGSMDYHNHMHNEDFVLFIYLSSCNGGKTVFHLNDYNEEYANRTKIELKPKKNLGAIFSSLVLHKGKYTEENKKIFVVGIRIDTKNLY